MHTPLKQMGPPVPTECLRPCSPSAERVDAASGRPPVYSTQEEPVEYLLLLRRHGIGVMVIFLLCLSGSSLYALLAPQVL